MLSFGVADSREQNLRGFENIDNYYNQSGLSLNPEWVDYRRARLVSTFNSLIFLCEILRIWLI